MCLNRRRSDELICKKCKFYNSKGTRYCQNCGNPLKKSFQGFLESLNLSGLAGIGLKDSSIAPLITEDFLRKTSGSQSYSVNGHDKIPVIQKEDGSWFCPDCGEKNKKNAICCKNCGRSK